MTPMKKNFEMVQKSPESFRDCEEESAIEIK